MQIRVHTTKGKLSIRFATKRDAELFRNLGGYVTLEVKQAVSKDMHSWYLYNVVDAAIEAAEQAGQHLSRDKMHELICTSSGLLNEHEVFDFASSTHQQAHQFVERAKAAVNEFFNLQIN